MKSYRTTIQIHPSGWKIGLNSPVLTAGSCFADAIGSRLEVSKFNILVNPFGTAYNPVSIHKTMIKSVLNEPPEPGTYLYNGGLHLNYDFHSALASPERSQIEKAITNLIGSTHYFLSKASVLILTYGTSWVYNRLDTGETVANCHKIPQKNFEKILLSENEILNSFSELFTHLKKFNPDIKIILTVSPVRHIKDTLELNSVSKSVLRSACHSISEKFSGVDYFPAYEIMMDDLRDYRFYDSDMIHPSKDAEDYIWEKFSIRYFDEATIAFLEAWNEIRSSLDHRPFHPSSAAHQLFLNQTLEKLQQLKNKVNVDEELAQVRSQIINNQA